MAHGPHLISEVRFGAFLAYSPRGHTPRAKHSRVVRDAIKNAAPDHLREVVDRLQDAFPTTSLGDILGRDVALVPTPRSAPLVRGGLWPAQRLADELRRHQLGAEVLPLLSRAAPVRKSAFEASGMRPTPKEHLDSLRVDPVLANPRRIAIVDDVVTKGATLLAAASMVKDRYPEADITAFGMLRTLGLQPDIEAIVAPCVGTITLTPWGEAQRSP